MSDDLTGIEILGYRLVALLGEGGMGSVWRAEHSVLGIVRAVKVLDPLLAREQEFVRRFEREARVQVSLSEPVPHPNIVQVENFSGERLAILMEYVEGRTLSQLITEESGPIPLERALPLMRQILAALEHAHGQQEPVIHRDIKPSNIMVTPAGTVKVMDFGIAKAMRGAQLTRTGTTLGTAAYMSPEQIKTPGQVDERSDIYSLGVTIYEMLAGRPPFMASPNTDADYVLKEAHVHQTPPDPRSFYPNIPEGVVRVALRALHKEPGARQSCVGELLAGLEGAAREPKMLHLQAGPTSEATPTGALSHGSQAAPTVVENLSSSPTVVEDHNGPTGAEHSRKRAKVTIGLLGAAILVGIILTASILVLSRSTSRGGPGARVSVASQPSGEVETSPIGARSLPDVSYLARLGERDHFTFRGKPLSRASSILRQDRANYHRFSIRDPEDQSDPLFANKAARTQLVRNLERITPEVEQRIINGTPLVRVQVWGDHATVTVIGP